MEDSFVPSYLDLPVEVVSFSPISGYKSLAGHAVVRVGPFEITGMRIIRNHGGHVFAEFPDRPYTTPDGGRAWQKVVRCTDTQLEAEIKRVVIAHFKASQKPARIVMGQHILTPSGQECGK